MFWFRGLYQEFYHLIEGAFAICGAPVSQRGEVDSDPRVVDICTRCYLLHK